MKILWLMIFATLLSACAVNGFQKFYTPMADAQQCQDPKSPCRTNPRFIQYKEEPPRIFIYSASPQVDNENAWNAGYMPIGMSNFYGSSKIMTREQLLEQAKNVGAALVLVHSEYKDTLSGSVPFVVANPTQTTTVAAASSSGFSSAAAAASTTTGGGYTAYNMPYRIERFDASATFWIAQDVKTQRLGARTINLPESIRSKLQRNTGILVIGVIQGTPAFSANILKDDVILKIGNEDVIDVQSFQHDQLTKFAGQRVDLQIVRADKPMSIPVTLNQQLFAVR